MVLQASDMEGVDDLLHLNDFSETTVLHNVQKRYVERGQVFTSLGAPILIAVNPMRRLPLYTIAIAQRVKDYSAKIRGLQAVRRGVENPGPHLFTVAEDSFQGLIQERQNQSIIITGESGAGKTEACKVILAYIARAHIREFPGDHSQDLYTPGSSQQTSFGRGESIEDYIMESNPVLEAFGNAKTVRNFNSSRFGKFIQVNIQAKQGNICSSKILTYLLEKSRAVSVAENERSFHIFYQALASADIRTKYGLHSANPADYGFLKNKSATYSIEGVDDGANQLLTV